MTLKIVSADERLAEAQITNLNPKGTGTMTNRRTYVDEGGHERPTNPPNPRLITLTPNQIADIFYSMGLGEVDVESFIVAAHQRGLTSEQRDQLK